MGATSSSEESPRPGASLRGDSSDDEERQSSSNGRGGRGENERLRNRDDSDDDDEEEEYDDADEEDERRNREGFGDILFGGDRFSDILQGFPQYSGDRRIARPPRVHKTQSVQCDFNLSKETLRLLPVQKEEALGGSPAPTSLYQVRFNFDSTVDCRIRLFFVAQERRDENNRLIGYTPRVKTEVPTLQFAAGLGQEYVQPVTHPLDTSLFQEADLEYDPKTQTIPVVIILEPLVAGVHQKVSSQTTFATLLKCSDNTFAIKAIKVKIEYCGATYVVHDIFGLDQSSESGRECVICMTEARDTIVLPCRHMCLCRGCAEVLRYQTNKCPICRSLFTALLKIEVEQEEQEQEEEGALKRKKTKRGEKHEPKETEHKNKKTKKEEQEEEVGEDQHQAPVVEKEEGDECMPQQEKHVKEPKLSPTEQFSSGATPRELVIAVGN